MGTLEIAKTASLGNAIMAKPHSHDYYELYFLTEGNREVFLDNKMFSVKKNSLVVIPPFSLHKTEGGTFTRINVNIHPDRLSEQQRKFLDGFAKTPAMELNERYRDTILRLLSEGAEIQTMYTLDETREEYLSAVVKLLFLYLGLEHNPPLPAYGEDRCKYVSSEMLKIIHYLNEHYNKPVTLKELCERFFLSKASLCKKFKSYMDCSVMDYILELRLRNAQKMLQTSDKPLADIAIACGFSSVNYFRNTFKKGLGISPLKYRKEQKPFTL